MDAKQLNTLLACRAEEFCQRFFPDGRKEGGEWKIGDVSGSRGHSLGIQLTGPKRGLWKDRATDDGGTLLDLLKHQHGGDFPKAADEARRFLGLPAFSPSSRGNGAPHFNPLKFYHPRYQRGPDAAWAYHDSDGHVIGYVGRFNLPDGAKDILPMRLIDGRWQWKGWKAPELRPIYNLHLLKQQPDAPVLIVEGEKKADAARRLFPDLVAIGWQGGAKAVQKVDWKPIRSRKTPIILWPDNDDAGQAAMLYLKALLPDSIRVTLPPGLPDGWDLADPPPSDISLRGLLDAALNPPPPAAPAPPPFRLLGFDDSKYHYGCNASGLVVELEAAQHTELQLQRLAPEDHWAREYPSIKPPFKTDYNAAAKDLIARQHAVGFFNPDLVRGRGCWLDDSRVIYHAGDRLVIDGVESSLSSYSGRYLYARRPAGILVHPTDAASLEECGLFLELCRSLQWRDPSAYWMFAGWIACSLVCGVLDWRPHIHIYGPKGCGKTWTLENIVGAIVLSALRAQSNTTEAGLRQTIKRDAISVLFDEMEPRDERAIARISTLYELIRQSSSETGASIIKGSPSGHAQHYRIRSCFCLASIASGNKEAADESRITLLELARTDAQTFTEILKLWRQTLALPNFGARLMARAISRAAFIRQASTILSPAIARAAGDSRAGQQYGALASGYWALLSDALPTEAEADDWANSIPWGGVLDEAVGHDDPYRCLEVILQSRISFDNAGYRETASIGELIKIWSDAVPSHASRKAIERALMNYGVHPISTDAGDAFDIACRHIELSRLLHGTPYQVGWKDHLKRVDGAKTSFYQPPGCKSTRAIRIPIQSENTSWNENPQPELNIPDSQNNPTDDFQDHSEPLLTAP